MIKKKQDAEAKLYYDTKAAEGVLITQKQDAEAGCKCPFTRLQVFRLLDYEADVQQIDYSIAKKAEANLFAETKAAQATITKADAAFYQTKKEADAMIEMSKAYGHMASVLGGPQGLLQYMMLERNTHEKLALANAQAINGLQPKITVWNTGDQSGTGGEGMGVGAIKNIMQSLPPLLSTINDQTGIQPPSWLAQMGAQVQGQGQDLAKANGKGKVNGTYVNGVDAK